MKLGMIGLGKMGANMAGRLLEGGHEVVAFDRNASAGRAFQGEGGECANSIEDLVARLPQPRLVWLMVPAGDAVEAVLATMRGLLDREDVVVDGGNSHYQDSIRHSAELGRSGIRFLDVGTSGGVWGRSEGYSMMIGGDPDTVRSIRPIFECLAPEAERGWGRVGPSGAGHFVKMVHNGIEYGLMQAYAEGFSLLSRKQDFDLDLVRIAEIWRHGSVIRSWLLELTGRALTRDTDLSSLAPVIQDSGEGRWTVLEALELDCPIPVITQSLIERLSSRDPDSFAHKIVAAMRQQFGGHAVRQRKDA